MKRILVGHTGFVGGHLLKGYSPFTVLIHRANLETLRGQSCDELVCAGLPAAKWIANREPDADRANLRRLCETLETVNAKHFTLISTIDVYPRTQDLDENFDCRREDNHAYGRHRLELETFVQERFSDFKIVRLPALFGTGLKKNAIYDLQHDNNLSVINPDSSFQWYPLSRLPSDLTTLRSDTARVFNLFTEPIPMRAIVERFFPGKNVGQQAAGRADYRLRTLHGALFGGPDGYVMTASQVMDALASYLREAVAST